MISTPAFPVGEQCEASFLWSSPHLALLAIAQRGVKIINLFVILNSNENRLNLRTDMPVSALASVLRELGLARATQQQRSQQLNVEWSVAICVKVHLMNITSFIASRNGLLFFAQPQQPQHIAGQGISQEQCKQHAGRIAENQDKEQRYQEDRHKRHAFAQIDVLETVERRLLTMLNPQTRSVPLHTSSLLHP